VHYGINSELTLNEKDLESIISVDLKWKNHVIVDQILGMVSKRKQRRIKNVLSKGNLIWSEEYFIGRVSQR
jgi:hypothetical protein